MIRLVIFAVCALLCTSKDPDPYGIRQESTHKAAYGGGRGREPKHSQPADHPSAKLRGTVKNIEDAANAIKESLPAVSAAMKAAQASGVKSATAHKQDKTKSTVTTKT